MESTAERAAAVKCFISEISFPEAVLYHIFKIYAKMGSSEHFVKNSQKHKSVTSSLDKMAEIRV